MSIDKNKIKPGDQVKIRYLGSLVSESWLTIDARGSFYPGLLSIGNPWVDIIEHKPNTESLEKAVADAQAALDAAKRALAEVTNEFPVGTRVSNSVVNKPSAYGTVVDCPKRYSSWGTSPNYTWVVWDTSSNYPFCMHTETLSRVE